MPRRTATKKQPAGEPKHLGPLPPLCPGCRTSADVWWYTQESIDNRLRRQHGDPAHRGAWFCEKCIAWLTSLGFVPDPEASES